MTSLKDRMIRAAKLDVNLYEEVEADKTAMSQAILVVLISSLGLGLGTISNGIPGLIWGTLFALGGWYLWAYLVYIIGTKLLPQEQTRSDHGELLRTIGFSASPGVLRAFAIIPGLGKVILFCVSAWMIIAMIIAVRQALDYNNTGRAILVCVIGWIIQFAVIFTLASVLGLDTFLKS
ncbi:MAG: hypothetical protein ABIA63_07345 [bacterium]